MQRNAICLTVAFALTLVALPAPGSDWTSWGGPRGDFSTERPGDLALSWPAAGPPVLWSRALGDHGHASILVANGTAITAFRRGDQDVVVSVDATSGATLWETAYDSPLPDGHSIEFGPGPHGSPLVVGGRVFVVSTEMVLRALDLASGEVLWQKRLRDEFELQLMYRGYGASPVAWKDLVIVNGGGEGVGLIALRQSDGAVAWTSLDGAPSYSTPLLADVEGTAQLVVSQGRTRAAVDPDTGAPLWSLELPETAATTMAPQFQIGESSILTTSAYADGTRRIDLVRDAGGWSASERWYTRKLRVMHQAVAILDGVVYASSGDFGPTFLTGVDLETGELLFRQRGFAKANVVRLGDLVLILDEDGELALGRPSRDGIDVLARHQVLDGVSWIVPTLVGTTLYVRDRTTMKALDLSRGGVGASDTTSAERAPAVSHEPWPGDALPSVPQRSASGLALVVPPEEASGLQSFHVLSGDDEQIAVTSLAAFQKTTLTSRRAVGYVTAPFDLEDRTAEIPLLSGALRIPVPSLEGAGLLAPFLLGEGGLDAKGHPEIGVVLSSLEEVEETTPADVDGGVDYRARAALTLHVKGSEVPLEAPIEIRHRTATNASMTRWVGDLLTIETRLRLPTETLGFELPPFVGDLVAETVDIDVFLVLSNASPAVPLDPSVPDDQFDAENRLLVLHRDLGNDTAALEHGRRYVRESWDDAVVLQRLARSLVTTPGLERRPLGLALEAAERANELLEGEDPLHLDTLARIRFETADVAGALEAQRTALERGSALPAATQQALRDNLARYEAAISDR